MERAYKLHGDVLTEHGVNKTEALIYKETELQTKATTPPREAAVGSI